MPSEFVEENWKDCELYRVIVCLDCGCDEVIEDEVCPQCGSIYLATEAEESCG